MRTWMMIAPVTLAVLAAGCGETTTQKASTGAAGGAVAGAVVGGPVGALAGAGLGGAGGAYRDEIEPKADRTVDEAFNRAEREIEGESRGATGAAIEPAEPGRAATAQRQADLTNQEVRESQTALKEMGLYDGEIDGLYGRRSINAVKEFQAKQNLRRTGALDDRTQQEIQMAAKGGAAKEGQAGTTGADQSPAAKEPAAAQSEKATEGEQRGATGAAIEPPDRAKGAGDVNSQQVREAQTALKDMGLYEGEVDGVLGARTTEAIREFQAKHDLERTGTLDAQTRQQLQAAAAQGGAAQERQPAGVESPPSPDPQLGEPEPSDKGD
jgi:peptidoglycan hydrolase-like protein with peptidoglycan-binding domain